MQKASEKAYISKKEMEVYKIERTKQLRKKQGFTEDEEMKDEEVKKMAAVADAKVHEESSGEEVDSDDLGDDITQKRQAPQTQIPPQHYMMHQQPQQRMPAPQ